MIKKILDKIAPYLTIISLIKSIDYILKLFKGNIQTAGIIASIIVAVILIACLIYLFSAKKETHIINGGKIPRFHKYIRDISKIVLVIFLFAIFISAYFYYKKISSPPHKITVLITKFEGPEPSKYRISDIIISEVKKKIQDSDKIRIISLNKEIREDQGIEYAQKLSKEYKAAIVIWGWYGTSNNMGILNIRFEDFHFDIYKIRDQVKNTDLSLLLYPQILTKTINSNNYIFYLDELDNYDFQIELSSDVSSIVNSLLGAIYFNLRDLDQAINYFNESNKFHNDNLNSNKTIINHQYLGQIYTLQKDYNNAIEHYTYVINKLPKNEYGYYYRGFCYYKTGNIEKAKNDYDVFISLNNKQAEVYRIRGTYNLLLKQYKESLEDYRKSIYLDKNDSESYNNLGYLKEILNEIDSALFYYNKAIGINPKDEMYYANRGRVLIKTGKIEEALNDCNKAIRLGNNFIAYIYRAEIWIKKGRENKALKDYDNAININPNYSDSYNKRAALFERMQEHESALNDYNMAIKLDSTNTNYYFNRGVFYSQMQRTDEAIQDFNIFIKKNVNDYKGYCNRGICLLHQNKYDKSIIDFDKYFELVGNYRINKTDTIRQSNAYNHLGKHLLINVKDYKKAIRYFNYAISMNVRNAEAYANRSESKMNLMDYKSALLDLDTAICINTKEAKFFNNRGVLKYMLKTYNKALSDEEKASLLLNNKDAITDYTKAIKLDSNKVYFFNRAISRTIIGDTSGSLKDYNIAINIDPQYGDAYYNRAILHHISGNIKSACEDWKSAEKFGINKAKKKIIEFCQD
jgi:tetratricopeptide (TPR) repeat protein